MGRLEKKRLFVQVLLGVQMMVLIGCIDNVNGGPQGLFTSVYLWHLQCMVYVSTCLHQNKMDA